MGQPTPVFLPGKSHGQRSLVGYSPWGRKESGLTEQLHFTHFILYHWRRKWQPTPVFLPRESHGQRGLVGCGPWGRRELDMTEVTEHARCWVLGHKASAGICPMPLLNGNTMTLKFWKSISLNDRVRLVRQWMKPVSFYLSRPHFSFSPGMSSICSIHGQKVFLSLKKKKF